MKKRLILIGVTVLVLALLGAGIRFVLKVAVPETPEEENLEFGLSVNDEGIRVYRFSPNNVDHIHVVNATDDYRVRLVNGQVKIVGFETVPLLAASASGLFNSVETVTLETVIAEHCADLSEFGLTQPQATVTIRSRAGKEVTIRIGDHTLTGDYYYMSVDGTDTVYLMDALQAERYTRSVAGYCDKKIYRPFEGIADVQTLSVVSPGSNYSFRRVSAEEKAQTAVYFSGFAMESPFAWGGDSDALEQIVNCFMGLTANEVCQMCVTEKDLAQYGLDAAHASTVTIGVYGDPNPVMYQNSSNPFFDSSLPTGEKQDFTVKYVFGTDRDRNYYVMFNDIPVVYSVPDSAFSFFDWSPYRYAAKMLFGEYISSLAQIDVVTPEETFEFLLKDQKAGDKMIVTCGTKTLDATNFRAYYAALLSVFPSGEASKADVTGDALLTMRFHRIEGETSELIFYPMDSRNCAVSVDGQIHLSVRINDVREVIENTGKVLKGQKIN